MKKNFVSGLLTGICGALLVFVLAGVIYLNIDGAKPNGSNGSATKAEDNSKAEDSQADKENGQSAKDQNYDRIVEKISFLRMLVDNYYLENVDSNNYAEGIYKGFISSLKDPYSTYYTKEEYEAMKESASGVYCGIGAVVSQNTKTGVITVVKPYQNGPAYEAGILPGDIIYMVENEEVTGVDLTEVVSRMKGVEGTTVNLTVMRANNIDPLEFEIVRKEIEVPTIESKMLENDIGYIIITEFDKITVTQFDNAISDLEAAGMKGLVIDLRDNPGGLLTSVVKMLDRLLLKGLVVYTEDKYGNRSEEKATDSKKFTMPLAVLINGNSASASEIFAGAVQDYEIGTVIGTTSFGKGIVQKVIPLSDGTAVKLTISKYFTPNGRNIHGTGIKPDVEIDQSDEMKRELIVPIDKDVQLQKAIDVLKEKIG